MLSGEELSVSTKSSSTNVDNFLAGFGDNLIKYIIIVVLWRITGNLVIK